MTARWRVRRAWIASRGLTLWAEGEHCDTGEGWFWQLGAGTLLDERYDWETAQLVDPAVAFVELLVRDGLLAERLIPHRDRLAEHHVEILRVLCAHTLWPSDAAAAARARLVERARVVSEQLRARAGLPAPFDLLAHQQRSMVVWSGMSGARIADVRALLNGGAS